MNRFKYGRLETPGLYLDETVLRMCYTHRHLFSQLALQLIEEGKNDKALKVLRKAEKVLPNYNVPNTFMSGSAEIGRAYALLGMKKDAKRVLVEVWNNAKSYAEYYVQLDGSRFVMSQEEIMRQLYIMQSLADVMQIVDDKESKEWTYTANAVYKMYQVKGGQPFETR